MQPRRPRSFPRKTRPFQEYPRRSRSPAAASHGTKQKSSPKSEVCVVKGRRDVNLYIYKVCQPLSTKNPSTPDRERRRNFRWFEAQREKDKYLLHGMHHQHSGARQATKDLAKTLFLCDTAKLSTPDMHMVWSRRGSGQVTSHFLVVICQGSWSPCTHPE